MHGALDTIKNQLGKTDCFQTEFSLKSKEESHYIDKNALWGYSMAL